MDACVILGAVICIESQTIVLMFCMRLYVSNDLNAICSFMDAVQVECVCFLVCVHSRRLNIQIWSGNDEHMKIVFPTWMFLGSC